MPDLEIGSLGVTGVNLDISPVDLPPQVFNNVLNLDFTGTHITPMVAAVSRASKPVGLGAAYFMESFYIAGDVLCWLVCGEASAHLLYMHTWYDITPAGMLPSKDYQSTVINGYLMVNNGRQKPFYVDIFDPLSPLRTYDAWPDNQLCRIIASLEGILIGFGPQDSSGIFNKSLMIWSDIADPGVLPSNFNFADPASRAGFTTLEGDEFPITARMLENRIQLYRSNSIYDIAYVGGTFVFSTTRRQLQPNLFSKNGVAAFRRSHFGIGDGYFFIFNGLDIQPLGVDECVATFFKTVNRSLADSVRVVYDNKVDEIMIAYPEVGFTACNKALIYDLGKKLWKIRELNLVTCISTGFFARPEDSLSWNNITVSWENWIVPWQVRYSVAEISNLVFAEPTGLFKIPDEGAPMTAFGQRLYCAFDSQDTTGRVNNRRSAMKLLTELFPEAVGRLRFRVGTSLLPNATFDWSDWQSFDAAFEQKLDLHQSGKFIAYEIDNVVGGLPQYFELTGFALNVKSAGRY